MPTIDLTQALQFIYQHGNIQDKARLLFILMGELPPDNVVRPLLDKQNPDGGFPSRPHGENLSSVDNTLTALWQLNEVGLLSSQEAKSAINFLITSQAEDGSWDENPTLPEYDLPPWIIPGQLATRLYLTAYSAYWLGSINLINHLAFLRAATFLAQQDGPEGQVPGYLHSQWITTSVFLMGGSPFSAFSDRGLSALQNRPPNQWETSQIAWALDCLGSAGLASDHPFVQKMLSDLAGRQEIGGSWSSEDGPAYAVSATISVLKAFKRFGLVEGLD